MLNPKLEPPAVAEAASRREAKLETNSNVPAYRQQAKHKTKNGVARRIFGSIIEKSILPYELCLLDLFRI
jgi:hypothetical protein